MEREMIIIVLIFGAVIGVLLICADQFERRYYRKHPPDDWDGIREERFDDDDD